MDKSHINKSKRLLDRKIRKHRHTIEKETGIQCTTTPTLILGICNAGLTTGLSEEVVYEEFSKYGVLSNIMMLPGKSCCFVTYKELNDAIEAYENVHTKLNIAQYDKPLYLCFTETVPQVTLNITQGKPPGLIIIENFINEAEEQLLLSLNDFTTSSGGNMKHRLVKHYGYEFRYDTNNVDKDCPLPEQIPAECDFLWQRLKTHEVNFVEPDQLTLNHYQPGQGIPPHVDTHSAFEDPIMSLSLGATVVMDFRQENNCHYQVLLPRRSLAIMSQESRYNWTHGITPRKMDVIPTDNGLTVLQRQIRVSFTFRKVRKGECDCIYKTQCDSFARQQGSGCIENHTAANLEKLHVQNVYENIAQHFSNTRHKPWPNVLDFVQSFDVGSILVDVGCGNGKYLGRNYSIFDIGCDSSHSLIDVCNTRGFQVFTCNCLYIPMRSDSTDGAISIAVIHHLANEERRLQAIKELIRILRTNGRALIYVWAKDQNKNKEKSSYLKQDRKNRRHDSTTTTSTAENVSITNDISLPVHKNRTQFQHQDVLVPWKLKEEGSARGVDQTDKLFLRYYHVFDEGELENLCLQLDNVEIVKSYYDQGNWCVILKKYK